MTLSIRPTKNKGSVIGGRKTGATRWPKRLRKTSHRMAWVNGLRTILKATIRKIYDRNGGIPRVPGCVCPKELSEIIDLDEIHGRHDGSRVIGALAPAGQQLLRRCCHTRKTAFGYKWETQDFRTPVVKEHMENLHIAIWEGISDYSKDTIRKSLVGACRTFEEA